MLSLLSSVLPRQPPPRSLLRTHGVSTVSHVPRPLGHSVVLAPAFHPHHIQTHAARLANSIMTHSPKKATHRQNNGGGNFFDFTFYILNLVTTHCRTAFGCMGTADPCRVSEHGWSHPR